MSPLTIESLVLTKDGKAFTMPSPTGDWQLLREIGYSPVQMLVSSIAGCGGYVYESVLKNSDVPHTIERVRVEYTRNEQKRSQPLASVDLVIEAKIPAEYHEKALRCLKLIAPNCPVIQSLDPAIQVNETVKFI